MANAEVQASLNGLDRHLAELEQRARSEGAAFWDRERAVAFEATNFAFLIRCLRDLLLLASSQAYLLDDSGKQAGRLGPEKPSALPAES